MRIFSGIQPTGRKHLGNYIGAISQYVAGQDRGEAIYCVVDLHATSVPYEPGAARGVRWDDSAFGITWPEPPVGGRTMSERDAAYPDFQT